MRVLHLSQPAEWLSPSLFRPHSFQQPATPAPFDESREVGKVQGTIPSPPQPTSSFLASEAERTPARQWEAKGRARNRFRQGQRGQPGCLLLGAGFHRDELASLEAALHHRD